MSIEENQIRLLIQALSGDFHTLARQRLEIEDMEYQIDTETVMIKGDFLTKQQKLVLFRIQRENTNYCSLLVPYVP